MEDLGSFMQIAKPGRPRSKSKKGTKTKSKTKTRKGSPEEVAEKFQEAKAAQEAALRDMEKDPTLKLMARDMVLNRINRMEERVKDARLQDILAAGKERAQEISRIHPVQYAGMNYFRVSNGAEYHLAPGISGAQFLRRQWVIINLAK